MRAHAQFIRKSFRQPFKRRSVFWGIYPIRKFNRILQRADLLAVPFAYESFGLVFPEAMRWGLPVIGSTAGAIPEIVEDRKTGLLVPPSSPQELAEAIVALLVQPRAPPDFGGARPAPRGATFQHRTDGARRRIILQRHCGGLAEEYSVMNSTSVSVVIPTYNYGHFVVGAVESVLAQTYQNVEIIVVNDGSSDDTKARLEPFMGRVRYIYQDNQGLSAARNTGIGAATCRWIAFLDSDDLWHPRKLELQMAYLDGHPEVGLLATQYFTDLSSGWPDIAKQELQVQRFLSTILS